MKTLRKIAVYICVLAITLQITGMEAVFCKAEETAVENNTEKKQKAVCFTKSGIVYRAITNKKVEVVGFTKKKSVISIPEKVKHKGKTYKVTQIADMQTGERDFAPSVYLEGDFAPAEYYPDEYCSPISKSSILSQEEIICDKLILPKTIEYIGEGAFYDCKIKNVEFASRYKKLIIGKYMFGINGPKTVVFPEGTREIGDYATRYASNITIPKTVKKIGSGVATYNTKKISIHTKNKNYKMKSGMLYTKDEKKLVGITKKVAGKSKIKLSAKTRYMSDYIFAFCEIKEVDFGGSILEISKGAFKNCKKLKELVGTGNVQKICYGAFDGCTNLKAIESVSNVTVIEDAAFWRTYELTLPISSKMDISPNAFSGTYINSSEGMNIIIAENDPMYSIENGLIVKTQGDNKTVIYQMEMYDGLEIPEGITSVAVALGSYDNRYTKIVFPESLKSHTGCVYIKDGTITYKSVKLPVFDRGFYIFGTGNVVVPRGMMESYKISMKEAGDKISIEYQDGFFWDDQYCLLTIREME